MVMQALCTKLNLSSQDTEECVKKVRTRNMGYLWANMEKIDVQGTYEALTQAKAALTAAENRAQNAETVLSETKEKLAVMEKQAQDAESENVRLKALLAAHGIQVPET